MGSSQGCGSQLVELPVVGLLSIDVQESRIKIQVLAFEDGHLATAQAVLCREEKQEQVAAGQRIALSGLGLEQLLEQGHMRVRHGKGNRRRTVKVPVDVWRELDEHVQALRQAHADRLGQLTAEANEREWASAELKADWLAERTREHTMSTDDPLFVSFRRSDHPTRKPMGDKGIEDRVIYYAGLIGLEQLRPHGLRATFITLTLENGATLEQTQYAAGHRDPRTTQRYRARKLNLDNNAVDKLTIRRRDRE